MFVDVLKNTMNINMDAHMYEIDKEKLKKVYNLSSKKQIEYTIIEKKIIYAKDDKKITHSKEDIELNYFSNYKFFREFLITGFESEETKSEIVVIKQLIENSKNLRENLMKHFDLENISDEGHENPDNHTNNNQNTAMANLFQKNKFLNNFTKMCKLLTLKPQSNKVENNPVFKLFSSLDNPSDIYSFSINENFLSNKLLNYKKKLTKNHYQEEFFCNFAKNYHNNTPINLTNTLGNMNTMGSLKNNQNLNNINHLPLLTNESLNIPPEIRQKFPVDYIDSIFRPREAESFYQIDSFMSMYSISQKIHLQEKDLYENIYGILSKCNYTNFMSYLYSKNNLFKYIYDEFTVKKSSLNGDSLENVNLSRIDSIETEKFFRGSELIISPKYKSSLNPNGRRGTIRSLNHNINIDDYLACHFVDKVCFMTEKLEEKIAEVLLKENNKNIGSSSANNIQGQFIKGSIINSFKTLLNKDFNFILLIAKNERLKIINYNSNDDELNLLSSGKINEIDEDLKKIQFYKIDKNYILDRFPGLSQSLSKDPAFKEIFYNINCYFVVEIKKYVNKRNSEGYNINNIHKFSLSQTNYVSHYHLFRVTNENIDRFELAINHLRLYENFEERTFNEVSRKGSDQVNNIKVGSSTNINSVINGNMMEGNNSNEKNLRSPSTMNEKESGGLRDTLSLKENSNSVFNNNINMEGDRKPGDRDKGKKFNSNKNNKRVSAYDEDFLGIPNDDILREVLYSKHGGKKETTSSKDNKKNTASTLTNNQNTNNNDEDENSNFDFRRLIDKEQQKKNEKEPFQIANSPSPIVGNHQLKNITNSSSNLESSPDTHFISPEISFKENYMFRLNNVDYKFSFIDRNSQVALIYYKYSTDEEDNNNNSGKLNSYSKTTIMLSEFKDYSVSAEEGKDYHRAIITLRFNDSRNNLEIVSYVRSDYVKFISKIEKFVKKFE